MTEFKNKYCHIREFKENRAAVCLIDKGFLQHKKNWGFIDSEGNEIIPCIYLEVSDFVDNEAKVIYKSRSKTDVIEQSIDLNGNLKTDKLEYHNFIPYHQICEFSDFCFKVERFGKWGLIDKTGNQILECQFLYLWDLKNEGAVISNINKEMTSLECYTKNLAPLYSCGLISNMGKILIPQEYNSFQNIYGDYYIIKKSIYYKNYFYQSFGYGLYDIKKQQEIVSCMYKSLEYIENDIFEVSLKVISNNIINNSSGLYTSSNKSEIKYTTVSGLLHVSGKCVLKNEDKYLIYPYHLVCEREDKFYSVYLNFKQGLINYIGELILEPKYQTIGIFQDGLAIVSIEDLNENISNNYSNALSIKFGLVDEIGSEVTLCEYDEIKIFIGGISIVKKGNKYGFIDKKGKAITDCIFTYASEIKNNTAIVATDFQGEKKTKSKSYYGLLDVRGNFIINHCDYIHTVNNNDNLFIVEKNNKSGGVNKDGIFVIPQIYDYIDIFGYEDGLLTAKLGEKYGAIDYFGKTIIPFTYDKLNCFSEGLALFEIVNEDGIEKIGYINSENEIIIPAIYDDGYNCYQGTVCVKLYLDTSNSRFDRYVEILIDKNGIELERVEKEEEIFDETENYNNQDYYDKSTNNDSHYNDSLDMDQQSKEYWEDLGLY
ncbi:MAG TPA: WG repeat-containing protein [Candidatus Paceibacterota bacterium]